MRILLFDDINTVQARRSLARALQSLGHEIITTDRFSRSHRFHDDKTTLDFIWKQVHLAIDQKPDVLLNFRPPTLLPEMVAAIRKAGIFTITWFTDDPVLYEICYKYLVESYDFILHAGDEKIISFYQQRHGISGVNFPFWTDSEEYKYGYDPDRAEYDVAFLGNCDSDAKSDRYYLLASLPYRVRLFGMLGALIKDPNKLWGGYIQSTRAINQALGKARCVINIPQFFKDYIDHEYYFKGLENLGFYEFPSRIPQYAAMGIPIINYGVDRQLATFPECIPCPDRKSLLETLERLLKDTEGLKALSKSIYRRYQNSFSAISRAVLLDKILQSPAEWAKLSIRDKAECFASVLDEVPDLVPSQIWPPDTALNMEDGFFPILKPVSETKKDLHNLVLDSPHKWHILYIGSEVDGDIGAIASARRALLNLGHTVSNIDLAHSTQSIVDETGKVICLKTIEPLINDLKPEIIVCNGEGLAFLKKDSQNLKDRGILLLGLSLSGLPEDSKGYTETFDFVGTASSSSLANAKKNGCHNVLEFPFGLDQSLTSLFLQRDPDSSHSIAAFGPFIRTESSSILLERLKSEIGLRIYDSRRDFQASSVLPEKKILEALQAARIHLYLSPSIKGEDHIGFNIFRSIGMGTAVFLQKTPALDPYFAYDTEVIGINNPEEIKPRIVETLRTESVEESYRRRSLQKLVSQNLFEHRWLDFFRIVESDIDKPTILPIQRAEILKPLLNTTSERYKICALEGFDEKNCDPLSRQVIQELLDRYRFQAMPKGSTAPQANSSINPFCGFHVLYNWNVARSSRQAYMQMLSSIFYNYVVGAEVFILDLDIKKDFLTGKALVSKLINETTKGFSRRDDSESIGSNNTSYKIPDLAYGMDLSAKRISRPFHNLSTTHTVLTINLRGMGDPCFKDKVASLLKKAIEIKIPKPVAVVGIPYSSQIVEIEPLDELLKNLSQGPHLVLEAEPSTEDWIEIIKSSHVVISSELSALVLAHRLGVPAMSISGAYPIQSHFSSLGLSDSCFTPSFEINQFITQLEAVLKMGQLPEKTSILVSQIEQQAQQEINRLFEDFYRLDAAFRLAPINSINYSNQLYYNGRLPLIFKLTNLIVHSKLFQECIPLVLIAELAFLNFKRSKTGRAIDGVIIICNRLILRIFRLIKRLIRKSPGEIIVWFKGKLKRVMKDVRHKNLIEVIRWILRKLKENR